MPTIGDFYEQYLQDMARQYFENKRCMITAKQARQRSEHALSVTRTLSTLKESIIKSASQGEFKTSVGLCFPQPVDLKKLELIEEQMQSYGYQCYIIKFDDNKYRFDISWDEE